ncbi:hypothetical protein [Sporosarcina aquimarina]|uniref:DUF3278 domain-containing protein n=1 Tax=Sporosarcina aquimarina TaxID=114975 RepID=A0ABU4FZT6_9BACL|nr:hypothetical protein [Sporosarcina aquimarina]MDW0110221.1 hypothetical protein [Sporosarcina aquimarina]
MEKTWVANLLSKDEYREKRFLYFVAESVLILSILLFLYLIVDSFLIDLNVPGDVMALISLGFLSIYILLRSTLTGIEYPEIATKVRYKKEKRSKVYGSIRFGILFIIVYGVFKGIPANLQEVVNVIGPATLATIFFFLLNYISLRKSYSKNRKLLDD